MQYSRCVVFHRNHHYCQTLLHSVTKWSHWGLRATVPKCQKLPLHTFSRGQNEKFEDRPRTKFWPRGQLGLEDLTSLVLTPNCPFPFDDHHQNLIHPYWARPHSPPQTASRSNQPCHHCSHVQTDRWLKRKLYPMSTSLCYADSEWRANNITKTGSEFII